MFDSDFKVIQRIADWANARAGDRILVIEHPDVPWITLPRSGMLEMRLACGEYGSVVMEIRAYAGEEFVGFVTRIRVGSRRTNPEEVWSSVIAAVQKTTDDALTSFFEHSNEHDDSALREHATLMMTLAAVTGNWALLVIVLKRYRVPVLRQVQDWEALKQLCISAIELPLWGQDRAWVQSVALEAEEHLESGVSSARAQMRILSRVAEWADAQRDSRALEVTYDIGGAFDEIQMRLGETNMLRANLAVREGQICLVVENSLWEDEGGDPEEEWQAIIGGANESPEALLNAASDALLTAADNAYLGYQKDKLSTSLTDTIAYGSLAAETLARGGIWNRLPSVMHGLIDRCRECQGWYQLSWFCERAIHWPVPPELSALIAQADEESTGRHNPLDPRELAWFRAHGGS